jgi:hypothetical protein
MILSSSRAEISPPAGQESAITVDSAIVESDLIARLVGAQRPGAAPAALPDPVRLGRRMAAMYADWERARQPDLPALAGALLHSNAIPPDGPLARTCLAAAQAVAAWGGLPYHSATHHAEVATNATVLTELAARQGQPVSWHARALLLAACLGHDLNYLPSVAKERFAAEHIAAEALDGMAAACGCEPADRQAIRALVIATEPGLRLRPGGPLGTPLDPTAARLLHPAAVDPALAALAEILSDADLLSSVGLTTAWYRVQQKRLEREAGRAYEAGDSERFFSDIVGPDFLSAPGRVFSANLALIRRTACGAC